MESQKSLQSIDSTAVRHQDHSLSSHSPQKWKQLEAKYLKYIALLKSKANKSNTKLINTNRYTHLLYSLQSKIHARYAHAFKAIQFVKHKQSSANHPSGGKGIHPNNTQKVAELCQRIQSAVNKHLRKVFLSVKTASLQNPTKQLNTRSKRLLNPSTICANRTKPRNKQHLFAISQLQKLQSTIDTYSTLKGESQLVVLKTENSRLKEEMKILQQSIKSLNKELKSTHERMEMELLKKSLALMESEVDSQEKDELIKQYQIQLKCRMSGNNRDFEIERARLELINQKLYKEFESTKETFVEEVRNQNAVINDLRSKLEKANVSIFDGNLELQSLRAYKFQSQYQKQCQRHRHITRLHSLKLPSQSIPRHSIPLEILKHIQSHVMGQITETRIFQYLTIPETLLLQSIQQRITSICANTIKNTAIKLHSLQKPIPFEENVRVSTEDLNSFLDFFETQPQPSTPLDTRTHQNLQTKILSLNQRLFNVRELILSLLQSIQIKNPTRELLELMESISDIFQFSEPQKESFHGGRQSIFKRIFY